jgi:hypothetical protein
VEIYLAIHSYYWNLPRQKKNRIIITSNHKNIPASLPFFVNIFFSKTESREKIGGFLQSNHHQSFYGTIIIKKKIKNTAHPPFL